MKNFSLSKLAGTVLSQRKLLNLTQQQLADKAGINRSMLCKLENQDYVPSLDQLTRLANTLRFDVADVFIEYRAPVFHHVAPRKIAVFGAGHVGLSIATLLARHHKVTLVDSIPQTVEMINQRVSPIQDEYIARHFAKAELNLTATLDGASACRDAEYAIIAAPTAYDPKRDYLDASPVETAIKAVLSGNPDAVTVIKSTVPVGYTAAIRKKLGTENIIFSPDFIRESKALYDNLYPSRIIVGCDDSTRERAETFAGLLRDSALKKEVDILITGLMEAEAAKHFANAYLALRASFFNELDTYAETKGLSAGDIVQGVCLDPRIGMHYNNPSFGLGGNCLPINARQLQINIDQFPGKTLTAVVESNRDREDYIAERILELAGSHETGNPRENAEDKKAVVGVFHPDLNGNSGLSRHSPIREVVERIKGKGATIIIYEPALEDGITVFGSKVINNIKRFKKQSAVIIANRYDPCLDDVRSKVYTRDLSHFDPEMK